MLTGYFLKSDTHHKGDTEQYNSKYYQINSETLQYIYSLWPFTQ